MFAWFSLSSPVPIRPLDHRGATWKHGRLWTDGEPWDSLVGTEEDFRQMDQVMREVYEECRRELGKAPC